MTRTPKSKGELPFDHELIDLTPSKTEAVLFGAAWLLVAVVTVVAIAGTAGYVYTRWLS